MWKIILLKYPSQLLLVSNVPLSASNSFFPSVPEFQPGVPWKGIQNIDPESDPYVTPGSVLGGTATSPIVDTDHQLLRDNTTGKTVNSWHMITYVWYLRIFWYSCHNRISLLHLTKKEACVPVLHSCISCKRLTLVQIMAFLGFNSETGLLFTFFIFLSLIGSNSSLNTSLPSPGAWPYSASDNSFTNVHSTSGMQAPKFTWTEHFSIIH